MVMRKGPKIHPVLKNILDKTMEDENTSFYLKLYICAAFIMRGD